MTTAICTVCPPEKPEVIEGKIMQDIRAALDRHYRSDHPEVELRLWRPDDKEEFYFSCGHRNYGTLADPASVYDDCSHCGKLYCDWCNYNRHICGGCGEYYDHGRRPHPGVNCVD